MAQEKALTVSEINSKIKSLIENSLHPLWIIGEISNFKPHSSGHIYFSLKDHQSQIRCVMFRSAASLLGFQPEHGMSVRAYGSIGIFEKYGSYQLYVEKLEPVGLGALHQAFEALKRKLQKEGLFDESMKKKIPFIPDIIGIVTSATGAAIRDITNVISRRYPNVKLLLCSVHVQGEPAKTEIAQAIMTFDAMDDSSRPDVLIVGRGGGSLEDLWAFNEEIVARAISVCRIPIISAVGHEIDFTIADFVADCRAETPSAAAEIVVPNRTDLMNRVKTLRDRFMRTQQNMLENYHLRLNQFSSSLLFRPDRLIQEKEMMLDKLEMKISETLKNIIQVNKQNIQYMHTRLLISGPKAEIIKTKGQLESMLQSLHFSIRSVLESNRKSLIEISHHLTGFNLDTYDSRLKILIAHFGGFDPKGILSRGYALCVRKDGSIITSYQDVKRGEKIDVELKEGYLDCRVEDRRFL